jgi:hypothetical protein
MKARVKPKRSGAFTISLATPLSKATGEVVLGPICSQIGPGWVAS